ncbi:unnamed protein product [Caenorhabditis bovis]|uniref:NADP-dependent oxidoreductase domain-containing protein n=1 Tax=Caenorhabditis bovis TaxID=2654633 RepID=A0A8S1E6I9_9PELO|nr:unnamed protein product [Caenorhabditis bovis]
MMSTPSMAIKSHQVGRLLIGGGYKLNSGFEIPMIGMGCSRNIEKLDESVEAALKCGYRLFDTARIYNNEDILGASLKKHMTALSIPREDIFITTKVPITNDSAAESVDKYIEESLAKLQVSYLDLVLVHYPRDRDTGIDEAKEINELNRRLVYQKLEHYCGIIRSIGVSNYEVLHLFELFKYCRIPPAVNQIEYHPYCTKPQVVDVCRTNNIFVQAYSSLCWGNKDILQEDIVVKLSEKYNVPPQIVLLRFGVSSGVGIIPKSATPSHIEQNLCATAQLSFVPQELDELKKLDRNQQFCPNCYPWRVL